MARDEGVAGVYPFFGHYVRDGDVILGDIPRVFIRSCGMRGLFLRVVFVCFGDNDGVWRGRRDADWRVAAAWRHPFECVEIYYTHCDDYYGTCVTICATVIYADEVVLWIRDSNTHPHRSYVFCIGPNGDCAATLGVAHIIRVRSGGYVVLCRRKWHGDKCTRVRIRSMKRRKQANDPNDPNEGVMERNGAERSEAQ